MRRRLLMVISALVCMLTVAIHGQQQFQLFANVVDSSGKPVTTLQPDDIQVMENGVEAKVLKVEPSNWPIKLQILVDNGTGLGANNLVTLRNGLRGLIESMPEGVELTLVTTSPQPRFVLRPSTDRKAQLDAVDKIAPDSNVGRFVESLVEATQRIEKDKTDFFPVIVSLGTTYGDNRVLDRDINDLMTRLEKRPTTVHVVMVSGGPASSAGGAVQTEVGMNVTKFTRGRYENIAAPSRIATLLPEIGAHVAKTHERQRAQFRITAARTSGTSKQSSQLSMSAKNGLQVSGLSADGR